MCMNICIVQNLWDLYQISSREAYPSIINLYMNLRIKKCDPGPPISFVLSIMKLLAVGFESTINCGNNKSTVTYSTATRNVL